MWLNKMFSFLQNITSSQICHNVAEWGRIQLASLGWFRINCSTIWLVSMDLDRPISLFLNMLIHNSHTCNSFVTRNVFIVQSDSQFTIHNIFIVSQHTSYMIHNVSTQLTFYRHIHIYTSMTSLYYGSKGSWKSYWIYGPLCLIHLT